MYKNRSNPVFDTNTFRGAKRRKPYCLCGFQAVCPIITHSSILLTIPVAFIVSRTPLIGIVGDVLAAARSTRSSDSPLDCHSLLLVPLRYALDVPLDVPQRAAGCRPYHYYTHLFACRRAERAFLSAVFFFLALCGNMLYNALVGEGRRNHRR